MIDDLTVNAFGDELTKIAGVVGNLSQTMKKWVSTGWNKPAGMWEKAMHLEGPNKGQKILDAAGKQVWHERPNATWFGKGVTPGPGINNFRDVTKVLPVGDKSLVTGVTALSAPAAFKKDDPEGLGRSRVERISGLAGGTVGSLMGMGALAHLPMKGWGLTRSIIGGLGGGILGERLATEPFHRTKAVLPPAESISQANSGVAT